MSKADMDAMDRNIINRLQSGLSITENPFQEVATALGMEQQELLDRLQRLLNDRLLSRFGPMYDAQKLGGAFSLVALRVPEQRFEQVTNIVNGFTEVAHNYQREHEFNMWYVLATESPEQIDKVNKAIEQQTGLKVYNMPKLEEYFIGLELTV